MSGVQQLVNNDVVYIVVQVLLLDLVLLSKLNLTTELEQEHK